MKAEELRVWDKILSVGHAEWEEGILIEVEGECVKQLEKWGVQNHADGTGGETMIFGRRFAHTARDLKALNDYRASGKGVEFDVITGEASACKPAWSLILLEEVYEAVESDDVKSLRAELIQVAAVAASWIEAIDRREE